MKTVMKGECLKLLAKSGRDDIATVYVAELEQGKKVEFVESVQPPLSRMDKWVIIVSSLYGCPVGCRFCDAGGQYHGKLSEQALFAQIDYLVTLRFGSFSVPSKKFKIQFARMGEPAMNRAVIGALAALPDRYNAPGLLPSISTIAPFGTDSFFEGLLSVKRKLYDRKFQLQFSIHTTDVELRSWLIPVKIWDFKRIAAYGERFYAPGGKKITLNFALADSMPIETDVLLKHFDPAKYLVKITPVNPTIRASENRIESHIVPGKCNYAVIDALKAGGYEVILSIGELEENKIGSNCGQYLDRFMNHGSAFDKGYTYALEQAVSR